MYTHGQFGPNKLPKANALSNMTPPLNHANLRAGPVVGFAVKFAAIQVAWALQRVISTVHSAIRGGFLFSRASVCTCCRVCCIDR